jgi:DNA primase
MDNVSQIKEKLDIVDVVGSYVDLKKAASNYKGLCPFHGEKTPSFMVSPELQIFKCFGCQKSGDMFTFVQEIEGVEFSQALEQLAERAGVKIEKGKFDKTRELKKQLHEVNAHAAKFYTHLLTKHASGKEASKYLKEKRKLKPTAIEIYQLGYAPQKWDVLYSYLKRKGVSDETMLQADLVFRRKSGEGCVDKFRNRVMFPVKGIDGKIIGFTARALGDEEPKYLHTKENPVFIKRINLYGLYESKIEIKNKGAVLVEGPTDCINASQNKIKNVIAPLGTALTEDQLKILQRYTSEITFCFDRDTAGAAATYRAISLAEKQNFNIKVAILPENFKDLDDLLQKDASKAKQILKDAVSPYDFFMADNLSKHNKETAHGKKRIIENLTPLYSKITNKVVLEHYVKELSQQLNTAEETLYDIFKNNKPYEEKKYETTRNPAADPDDPSQEEIVFSEKDLETYFLALMLHADIDTIKSYMYNLKPKDFSKEALQNLVKALKKLKKNLKIKTFLKTLDEKTKTVTEELYMWEALAGEEKEDVAKELEKTYKRLKTKILKKRLRNLTNGIELAEKQGDTEKIKELTDLFEKHSKELL